MNNGGYLLFKHGGKEGEIRGDMFGETFYYSCLNKQEVRQLLLKSGFEIELWIKDYTEIDLDRDLVEIARKIK